MSMGMAKAVEFGGMIGEALEITIAVSMLVLVGYPSTLMVLDSLRGLQKRMTKRRHGNGPASKPA